MALIKCKECGKEVSSLAKNCPNCGAPIMVMKKVKVHFWRKKKFGGSAITGSVFIDGQHIGIAHNGCEFDVYLPVGNHTISTETTMNQYGTGGKGDSRNIQIQENMHQVNIELIPKSTFLTGGWAYLAIKDVDVM